MPLNFSFNNIVLRKHEQEKYLVIKGEVINSTGANYQSVVFRMVLFIRSVPIANTSFTINGFYNGQSKTFEKQVGEVEYDAVIKDITKYEIYAESGY